MPAYRDSEAIEGNQAGTVGLTAACHYRQLLLSSGF
jgi:hypothetical protein